MTITLTIESERLTFTKADGTLICISYNFSVIGDIVKVWFTEDPSFSFTAKITEFVYNEAPISGGTLISLLTKYR